MSTHLRIWSSGDAGWGGMDPGDSGKILVGLYLYYKLYSLCVCSVAQLCLTLCDPMDCGLPGSSAHGIFPPRILEWVAISSSRRSSWPRDQTHASCASCIGTLILYHWVTWKSQASFSWVMNSLFPLNLSDASYFWNIILRAGNTNFCSDCS